MKEIGSIENDYGTFNIIKVHDYYDDYIVKSGNHDYLDIDASEGEFSYEFVESSYFSDYDLAVLIEAKTIIKKYMDLKK
jgi:hypothetical protein